MSEINEVVEPVEEVVAPVAVEITAEERYKNDMFKFKRELQEEKDKRETLEGELRTKEEEKLKATNNYKSLYEKEQEARVTLEDKYNGLSQVIVNDKKFGAIKDFAVKAGLRPEAVNDLKLFDNSEVIVETTSEGSINILGAEQFVEGIKSSRPYLFVDSNPPNVNNSTGNFNNKDKTYSPVELLKLEKENKSLYTEIMTKKRHLIRR